MRKTRFRVYDILENIAYLMNTESELRAGLMLHTQVLFLLPHFPELGPSFLRVKLGDHRWFLREPSSSALNQKRRQHSPVLFPLWLRR